LLPILTAALVYARWVTTSRVKISFKKTEFFDGNKTTAFQVAWKALVLLQLHPGGQMIWLEEAEMVEKSLKNSRY
jgi:hypothetical protein